MSKYRDFSVGPEVKHVPGSPDVVSGRFVTPCRCGYETRPADTASLSYQRATTHAEKANAQESRPTATVSLPASRPTAPRRASVGAPLAGDRSCGCGCQTALSRSAKGLFAAGHDAKFKGILKRAHLAGQPVAHPETGETVSTTDVAAYLDTRRGGGDFWLNLITGAK